MGSTRRDTRNSKHLFDFDNSGIHTRRRSKNEDKTELRSKEEVELVSKNCNDKNNKDSTINGRMNGKLRRLRKADDEKDEENHLDQKDPTETQKEQQGDADVQGNEIYDKHDFGGFCRYACATYRYSLRYLTSSFKSINVN